MNWSEWVQSLAAELAMTATITAPTTATPSTVADFNTILPRCVEFTELKMLRDPDLDFLAMRTFDATTTCTVSSRVLALPAQIIIPITLNIITPVGTAPDAGTRNPVQSASIEFINMLYSATTTDTGVPRYYALTDNAQAATNTPIARLGPTPDAGYVAEWYGTFRPTALTANTSNYLSTLLPDLYLAASMIFMSGYQRDFGAQSDDPKMAVSWMQIYESAKQGAAVEEARRKSEGASWTAYAQTRVATPPRA